MTELIEQGRWTRAAFTRILKAARSATGGQDCFCEFVLNQAQPDWLKVSE